MWFDDDNTIRRRKTVGRVTLRANPVLRVTARKQERARRNLRVLALAALACVLLGAAGWGGYEGLRWMGRRLFSENPRFAIRQINIRNGGEIVGDFIRGKFGVREGRNLFGFEIDQVRAAFLAHAHNYREMRIVRRLPGTLDVEVEERRPLARLGRSTYLVVDAEGYAFNLRRSHGALPVITGYRERNLGPGERLRGMSLAAVEVLEACDDPLLGLTLDSVDVAAADRVVLRLQHRGRTREIDFAWPDMGTRTVDSRSGLERKLKRLVQVLQTRQADDLGRLDATLETDRFYGQ